MIIAVHQPQYMPWLGYFAKMAGADHFVLLDTVQYKKNEWQNRNRVKNATGWQWLTVPVSPRFPQAISAVRIDQAEAWQRAHRQGILTNYRRAPFFAWLMPMLDPIYDRQWLTIGELNIAVVKTLAQALGIRTPIHVASELGPFAEQPDERLIGLVRHLGGSSYLAGSGGLGYMDLGKWAAAGIAVEFQEYQHPVYPQLFGPFEPNLSVLDLLFNCGPESLAILQRAS